MRPTIETVTAEAREIVAANPSACMLVLWEPIKALGRGDLALQEAALGVLCDARTCCTSDCNDDDCTGTYG